MKKFRRLQLDFLARALATYHGGAISSRYLPPTRAPGSQSPLPYSICRRCVMDTTDPEISFDADGICNYCHSYDSNMAAYVDRSPAGWQKMEEIAAQIKLEGQNKPYDCIIGLSGGVDSTYVAYLVIRKLGLRPLAIHVDNGWNSEIAVSNIEKIVTTLGIDLHTVVLDWEEFQSLQAAFVRAGVPDCEIPTDHAITACLYQAAIDYGVRYIIGGSNLATEQMVPRTWSAGHGDWRYIQAINRDFGSRRLKTYPHFTFWEHAIIWPYIYHMQMIYVLNYLEYNKFEAIDLMKRELGWVSYGGKHHESIYTRFYQTQYLIDRFNADKRLPHLSCLINDGRISREDALVELQNKAIDIENADIDRDFVLKKLGITPLEYERILTLPPKTYWDFESDERHFPDEQYQWALEHIEELRTPLKSVISWLLQRCLDPLHSGLQWLLQLPVRIVSFLRRSIRRLLS